MAYDFPDLNELRAGYDDEILALQTRGATDPAVYKKLESQINGDYRARLESLYNDTEAETAELEAQIEREEAHPATFLNDGELKEAQSVIAALTPSLDTLPTPNLLTRAEEAVNRSDRPSMYAYLLMLNERAESMTGREYAPGAEVPYRQEVLAAIRRLSAAIRGVKAPVDRRYYSRLKTTRTQLIREYNRVHAGH